MWAIWCLDQRLGKLFSYLKLNSGPAVEAKNNPLHFENLSPHFFSNNLPIHANLQPFRGYNNRRMAVVGREIWVTTSHTSPRVWLIVRSWLLHDCRQSIYPLLHHAYWQFWQILIRQRGRIDLRKSFGVIYRRKWHTRVWGLPLLMCYRIDWL